MALGIKLDRWAMWIFYTLNYFMEKCQIYHFSVLYCVFKNSKFICLDQPYSHICTTNSVVVVANTCRVVQAPPTLALLILEVSSMNPADLRPETRVQKSVASLP
jgi:hypothetical protein